MAQFLSLHDAVARYVQDGQSVALEGFTHLIPFAAGHEILRQGRRSLTLIRMMPDVLYDQMVGMGCAKRLVFSWGGNPEGGPLRRLRDAVERGYPQALELEEHTHAAMANAWWAGAAKLPFAPLKSYRGTGLSTVNANIATISCPFTGVQVAAVPALRPDIGIVHAQRADRQGNVVLAGVLGVQKEVILASRVSIVTVEEVVDELEMLGMNDVVLPGWSIDVVATAPRGAWPSPVHGYYPRDNSFYQQWAHITAERDRFAEWMQRNVLEGHHD